MQKSLAWYRYTITGHPREEWHLERRTGKRHTKTAVYLGMAKRDEAAGHWYGADGKTFARRRDAKRSVELKFGIAFRVPNRKSACR